MKKRNNYYTPKQTTMKTIIDTSTNTTSKIDALKEAGIETVIRYYCTNTQSEKCLKPIEAEALSEAKIQIGIVFQDNQNAVQYFDEKMGYMAGKAACNYALNTIHQPLGSVITFAVDFDPSENDINDYIIPYFKGVKQAFFEAEVEGESYKIGVYSSGMTCNMLWEKELCSYRWLSMSNAFRGTKRALDNGDYELYQLYKEGGSKIEGLSVDYNIMNPKLPGTFLIDSFSSPTESGIYVVNVSERNSLHLWKAADVDSEVVENLKNGQRVYVLEVVDRWVFLKTKINGELYHGFSFVEYLSKET